jgi:hypothetical protein
VSRPGRPSLIELAGLPGSGKTTIAARLAALDPSVHTRVLRPSLDPLFREPRTAWRAVHWGLLRPGLAWPMWAKLCLLRVAVDRLTPAPGAALLLEESLFHHSWRTLFRYPRTRAFPWARLVETGPPLVVLRATRGIRHTRLPGKRVAGDTNRRLSAGQPDEATWGDAERLFDEMVTVAARGRRVVEVPTDDDVESSVTRVREALGALS